MKQCTITILIIVFVAAPALEVVGQNLPDPMPRLFRYNQLFLNPAYAGMDGKAAISLSGQSWQYAQWTRSVSWRGSIEVPVAALHGTIGAVGNFWEEKTDYSFDRRQKGAGLVYSYHARLSDNWKLGIGTQATANNFALGKELQPGMATQYSRGRTHLDADAGLWLNGKKFFAGASLMHLFRPVYYYRPVDFNTDSIGIKKQHLYTFSTGYTFTLSPMVKISPAMLVQSESGGQFSHWYQIVTFNSTLILGDKMHVGVSITHDIDNYGHQLHLYYQSFTVNTGVELQNLGQLMLSTSAGQGAWKGLEGRLQVRF